MVNKIFVFQKRARFSRTCLFKPRYSIAHQFGSRRNIMSPKCVSINILVAFCHSLFRKYFLSSYYRTHARVDTSEGKMGVRNGICLLRLLLAFLMTHYTEIIIAKIMTFFIDLDTGKNIHSQIFNQLCTHRTSVQNNHIEIYLTNANYT